MRSAALLGTRLVVGGYLAVHGAQKLFGTVGGGLLAAGLVAMMLTARPAGPANPVVQTEPPDQPSPPATAPRSAGQPRLGRVTRNPPDPALYVCSAFAAYS